MSNSNEPDNVVPMPERPKKARPCPNCGKPQDAAFKPFCSKRCADVDLGRWLNEDYRVASNEAPDQAEEEF